jgi:hypothetical protein
MVTVIISHCECISKHHNEQGMVAWCIPVIPALRKLRLEDGEFKANLNFIVRPCLKNNKNKRHCIIHLKYIQILFVNYISIKLGKK